MEKTMKTIFIFINSYLLCLLIGNAQGIQTKELYAELGVKKIIEHLYVINVDGSIRDSILIEERYLDSLGRTTKRVIRDTSKYVDTYTYVYNEKSQLSRIKGSTTRRNIYLQENIFKYNDKGLVRIEKTSINGKTGGRTKYTYNSKDQLREEFITSYSPSKYYKKINYLYNSSGQILKAIATAKTRKQEVREYEYDEKGNLIYIHLIKNGNEPKFFIEYGFDDENRRIKEKYYCRITSRVPEVYANILSQKGDIRVVKYKYDEKGLLEEKKQWLHNIFIGLKRYSYEDAAGVN
ncbi:MAG: YD repeat-containing protein [Polaribacter sp.]|jgi:YD repeat-containing protein